jgi:hypothetical protein
MEPMDPVLPVEPVVPVVPVVPVPVPVVPPLVSVPVLVVDAQAPRTRQRIARAIKGVRFISCSPPVVVRGGAVTKLGPIFSIFLAEHGN